MLNETVYLNGVNTRYNFAMGVVNKIRGDGVCRVSLYDQGKPVTVNVHPSRLTKSEDLNIVMSRIGPVAGGVKAALRSLRDTRKKMFLPALSAPYGDSNPCNFIQVTGDPNAIPVNSGDRRFMVVGNALTENLIQSQARNIKPPAGYVNVPGTDEWVPADELPEITQVVITDCKGAVVAHVGAGWIGEANTKRELLGMLRTLGLDIPPGKVAIEERGEALVVMHRHSKNIIVSLEVQS